MFEKIYHVTNQHSAQHLGSGTLPVLATPALVAFMENAAQEAVQDSLAESDTTVGSAIAIKHLAASPIGAQIAVKITSLEEDGRRFDFKIEAYDGNKLIGSADHTRFSVNKEHFMARLN